jgi:hypothetical protein
VWVFRRLFVRVCSKSGSRVRSASYQIVSWKFLSDLHLVLIFLCRPGMARQPVNCGKDVMSLLSILARGGDQLSNIEGCSSVLPTTE